MGGSRPARRTSVDAFRRESMEVTFWGVRGSIPVPGWATHRYGGNTSCVSVAVDGCVLVLDAGTGIRLLGRSLLESDQSIFVLFTHRHTDHTQGFPFFEVLHKPQRRIDLLDYGDGASRWSSAELMDGLTFPVHADALPSDWRRIERPLEHLRRHGFDIRSMAVNHPGGAFGYRITSRGRSFVYIPDNELSPPASATARWEDVAAFCDSADVVCHDAHYLDVEMPAMQGRGHSTIRETCDLAVEAGVGHLVLFHHHPDRDDDTLARLEAEARERLTPHGIRCTAAYEGLSLWP